MTDETEPTGSIAVGEIIRSTRERAGMTQSALGEALNVTQTCVSYWEAGRRDIGVTDLIRIAAALGVQAADLLPLSGPGAEPQLPDGRWGRIEMPGYRQHTGWIADEPRFGQQAAVVRDWDGRVVAEVFLGPACRVVYLPTPLNRPGPDEPQAIAAGGWGGDLDDEGGPF
jgi:transcriptional regulator with XRE-family HTH domain